jgi:hypothetical protein
MKIAYLMLVHSNPQLQKRVIKTLSCDGCGFFIHVDAKSDFRQFSDISGENVTFIEPRMPVYWCEHSQVQATMLLIRQALSDPANYDYLVLLQGSDYPLRSGSYIRKFFDENRGLEFLSIVRMPTPGFPLSKINRIRYPSQKPMRRFVARAGGRIGLAQRDYRKYLVGLQAYAGDACWALTRGACEYLVEFALKNPHLEQYFQNTVTSDEMFFHTILGNSPFRTRCRRSLLYREYPPDVLHPALISDKHIQLFEAQDRVLVDDVWSGSGEILFARKFSDETLCVVDRIDEMIKRKEMNVPVQCRA